MGFFLALAVLVWAVCSLVPLAFQALRRGVHESIEGVGLLVHSSSARMSRLAERGRANSLWSGAPLAYALFFVPFRAVLSMIQWFSLAMMERRGFSKLTVQYAMAAALAVAIVWPVTQEFAASYKTGDVPEVGLKNYLTQDHQQPVTDPPHERLELSDLVESREAVGKKHRQTRVKWGSNGESIPENGRLWWRSLPGLGCRAGGGHRIDSSAHRVHSMGVGGRRWHPFALGTYYTVDDLPVSVKWDAEMVLSCLNDEGFVGPDGQEQACTPPKEDSVEGKIRLPLLWLNRLLGYLAEPLNFPGSVFGHDCVGHFSAGSAGSSALFNGLQVCGHAGAYTPCHFIERSFICDVAHVDGGLRIGLFGHCFSGSTVGLALGPLHIASGQGTRSSQR